MLEFKPIDLKDKSLVDRYMAASGARMAEHGFGNMFIWKDSILTGLAVVDGFLAVRMYEAEDLAYLPPFGEGNSLPVLKRLSEYSEAHGGPLRIICADREKIQEIERLMPCRFDFIHHRDYDDYFYHAEDLAELPGKKYHAKRNHVAKFKSTYDYSYEDITPDNLQECRELADRWFMQRDVEGDERIRWEIMACRRCFDHYRELDMVGGLLRADGKVIAFTVGSEPFPGSDTLVIHFEKALTEYSGVYAAISQIFAERFKDRYTYINREEDMGIEGLRKSKLSLHPCFLLEKYEVRCKGV